MNDVLMRLEQLVNKELENVVNKGDMSPSELEICKKAVGLLKEIKECDKMDSGMMDEYSRNSYGHYDMRGSYERGRSPVTGRYVSRMDHAYNDGSYGNNGGYNNSNRSYTNNGNGYSGHSVKDRMISRLEDMMGEVVNDYERKTVEDFIHRLETE